MARPTLVDDLLVGRALHQARRRRGLRQSEVAVAVGISVRTLQDYECGRSSVPVSRHKLLAEALGLDPALLSAPETPALPSEPLAPDEAAWLALYHRLPAWFRALFRRRHSASQPAAAQESAAC